MKLADVFLWPGHRLCQRLGLNPDADAGLIRWMFNTVFYLLIGLILVWIAVA
ncbi:hypothetical protein SAMN05444004_107124 [Jannaschia faecimaris]|uniref:Uncharacterized protein n=1 Tax=Jannaschia faecimaris TaxID=1244108 RepID=A0A1H3R3L1_9RHOB|nr:hypothetical protein [Jannaschia faecimaris]SDZ19818.1 hypothetical protein SAMN05444004_107124 [Jannaschia faecimaris]